ncbi:20126_t:CDS:1, partial [Funneliformis geosporum]
TTFPKLIPVQKLHKFNNGKKLTVSKCFTDLFKREESGGSFMSQIINKI